MRSVVKLINYEILRKRLNENYIILQSTHQGLKNTYKN